MSDLLDWRERPWTIRVIAGIGLAGVAASLAAGLEALNVALGVVSLVLLLGLWGGSPGVRLYYIFGAFVSTVVSTIGLIADPNAHWDAFVASVASFALLLAPPTHEWAQKREEQRALKRTPRRVAV